jgi:hypothetical protein
MKKNSTQVIETLENASLNEIDDTVTIPAETRDQCVKLLKGIDRRDEQHRKPRKKVVAKKAARRR